MDSQGWRMLGRFQHTTMFGVLCGFWFAVRAVAAAESPAPSPAPPFTPVVPVATASQPSGTQAAVSTAPLPQEQLPLGAPSTRSTAVSAPQTGSASAGGGWMLQTLAALGVVIGLILLLRLLLQKTSGAQHVGGVGGLVEVLARTPIAPRTHLLFLRINQRVVVAAQTPAGLSHLLQLDDPQDVAWVLGRVQSAKRGSITRNFVSLLSGFDREHDKAEGADTGEHRVDRARERLSGLMSRIRQLQRGGDA
jgi:flagellar biogenesis protein FliO